MDIVLLIGGLLLILVGANALTDGAASVAKRFNISSLVIGLTIVAFGTSAPELTVSVVSALKGSSDIAIGNVVGSNIFNALMIVGCTAAIVPISVTKGTLSKEIPLCVLASIVLFICANDVLINGVVAMECYYYASSPFSLAIHSRSRIMERKMERARLK